MSTINEILQNELKDWLEFYKARTAQLDKEVIQLKKDLIDAQWRIAKFEAGVECLARHNFIPEVLYEAMPSLRQHPERHGDNSIREVLSCLPPRQNLEGMANGKEKETSPSTVNGRD